MNSDSSGTNRLTEDSEQKTTIFSKNYQTIKNAIDEYNQTLRGTLFLSLEPIYQYDLQHNPHLLRSKHCLIQRHLKIIGGW